MWTVELAKAASLHYMVFLVCFPISLSWFKVYYCQFYYLFLGQSSYSGARNKSVMEPMFALQCWLKTCVSGVPLFWFNSATYSELWDHECASSAAVITVGLLKAEGALHDDGLNRTFKNVCVKLVWQEPSVDEGPCHTGLDPSYQLPGKH